MLTTEEEAKTKRCQEGYAASPGATRNPETDYTHQNTIVSQSVSYSGAGPVGVATTAVPMTAPIFCLGSQCMAWRWAEKKRRANLRPEPDDVWEGQGYCGKAGRP